MAPPAQHRVHDRSGRLDLVGAQWGADHVLAEEIDVA
jgi:hypothetical protein